MSCYNLQKGFRNNNFQTLTSFCLLGLVKWGFWLELPSHIKWSDKVCSKRNFLNDQHFFHDYHFKVIHDQVFLSVEMFTLTFASQVHMPSKSQIWKKQFRATLIRRCSSSRTIQTHCLLHVLSLTTEFSFSYLQLFRGWKLSSGSLAGTHI